MGGVRLYAHRMQTETRDVSGTPVSGTPGLGFAGVGLVLTVLAGLFAAQAGGGDREVFLSFAVVLGAFGLLGIVIGGVAIGVRLARG
ncbi:MAG: hypothetical protein AVDCRST_MAG34-2088 [uncultured Nocardioidaceae bacterium]|uniref:Uncharacterized protein n=1 Tax=uncultured Nocardioidaceae bacterium TaxID=253824 RepID=A0A6J4MCS1_9ACTN|nr:MAG: hypothetical protein AVDCRST_MAG34-2088 [uncultured Nocardioidaceae bacterium]